MRGGRDAWRRIGGLTAAGLLTLACGPTVTAPSAPAPSALPSDDPGAETSSAKGPSPQPAARADPVADPPGKPAPAATEPKNAQPASGPTQLVQAGERAELVARVDAFIEGAMFDHYDDGSYASFDATQMTVLEPAAYAGQRVTIFHDHALAPAHPFRAEGRRVQFSIETAHLRDTHQLFTGAAEDVRIAP